jgi:hypothetical protein
MNKKCDPATTINDPIQKIYGLTLSISCIKEFLVVSFFFFNKKEKCIEIEGHLSSLDVVPNS